VRKYLLLFALAALWAPSFLLIKIAVEHGMPPVSLATFRVSIGALAMWLVLRARGGRLPRDRASWKRMAPMGFLATALPFILFSWGEQHADSGLAAILNGTTPIFTVLIAHLLLADERLSGRKVFGLGLGFAGIALTFWPRIGQGEAGGDPLAVVGLSAFTVAALCYGYSTVYARRNLMSMPPLVAPTMQLIVASGFMLPAAFGLERPLAARPDALAVGSVIFLGLAGTALAYVTFYALISLAGATFASLVTYVLPPAGIALGMLVLGEEPGWQAVVGSGLIILGVLVISLRRRKPSPPLVPPPAGSLPAESPPPDASLPPSGPHRL
jgi:drug/metabolite transporter (DMT)-like permease